MNNDDVTGLLRVYSSLIINVHTSYDMSLLYRIFGLLLMEAYTQCNLDWGGLYLFFSDVVKSLRLVHMCICFTYIQVCICTCVFVCVYMCVCLCICVCECLCVSVCMCMCFNE